MIIDNTLVLSDAQAITASAASTNIIDLGAAGTPYGAGSAVRRDIGIGTNIPIEISVNTTFATLTSLTVTLQLDDDVAFGSPTSLAVGAAIPVATLVAGYRFTFPVEIPEGANERYMRLLYTVTGSNATAGKVFAGIVAARQNNA
jgi:hypothetical protein